MVLPSTDTLIGEVEVGVGRYEPGYAFEVSGCLASRAIPILLPKGMTAESIVVAPQRWLSF